MNKNLIANIIYYGVISFVAILFLYGLLGEGNSRKVDHNVEREWYKENFNLDIGEYKK